jgi:hypothetical protein
MPPKVAKASGGGDKIAAQKHGWLWLKILPVWIRLEDWNENWNSSKIRKLVLNENGYTLYKLLFSAGIHLIS